MKPTKTGYDEPWDGGFVRVDGKGRKVYVIRARRGGKRYQVSTRVHDKKLALEHWERFQQNPAGYVPYAPPSPDTKPLFLRVVKPYVAKLGDEEGLGADFLRWSLAKGNTHAWAAEQRRLLNRWARVMNGMDLRLISLRETILPELQGTRKQARIAVLKAFYSWLRKERHLLKPTEDPTHGTLSAPQSDPLKRLKANKAFSKKAFLRVRSQLQGHWKLAADVQAGTGWHVREVHRFAKAGRFERKRGRIVLVCPRSKRGGEIRTEVGARVLKAAKGLRRRGSMCVRNYSVEIKKACKRARIEEFTGGQFRHAVATWAVDSGASLDMVAAFLNHLSHQTTKRFYATHAIPAKVPTLL